jgi:Ca2+:H+ antiporter
MKQGGPAVYLKREWFLGIGVLTAVMFLLWGDAIFARMANPLWLIGTLAWLFAVILGSALSVVRHADRLAARLGEPYGTLILTLSVTGIEIVSISAVMMHGANNPTLVRDTLFSVIMIVLNGMVGLSLMIGALRHREQQYNLQGANTYLGVIIPLAVLSLILPDYTVTTAGPTLSFAQGVFLMFTSLSLYGAFLAIQTTRHREYFLIGADSHASRKNAPDSGGLGLGSAYHAAMLVLHMLPVIFLAEQLAPPVDYLIETMQAPTMLGGTIIAMLVATPEAIGAVRAARANDLQRSVNTFLGSVLSTIGLTIPAMLAVSYWSGRGMALGLEHSEFVMLLLTLTSSVVTFASGRTNVLQGAVHLILFAAYILLIVQG